MDAERFFRAVVGVPKVDPARLPTGILRPPDDETTVIPVSMGHAHDWPGDNGFLGDDPQMAERARLFLADQGIDAVAVYAPYSTWGIKWGIYYFVSRLYEVATLLVTKDPALRLPGDRLVGTLLAVIRQHELLHFRVELAAIHQRAATSFDHFDLYSRRHSWSSPGSDGLEEAIANAYKFDACRSLYPELAIALDGLTPMLPFGYRDHGKYRNDTRRRAGLEKIAARLLNSRLLRLPADLFHENFGDLYAESVPEYLVDDGTVPSWFRDQLSAQRFRQLTLREVKRHAEKSGAVVQAAGRHQWKVKRANKRPVPLPDHPRTNRGLPPHIVGELADLFDLTTPDYVDAVLAN